MPKRYFNNLAKEKHLYEIIYFDIKILNDFFNDPRYHITNFDYKFYISIQEEFDESKTLDKREKIVLDQVGLGCDSDKNLVIGIFLKQLIKLDPITQIRFSTYITNKQCFLNPYFINSVNGNWSEGITIFDAILELLEHINSICIKTNNKKFFRKDFKNNKPKEFKIMISSTKKEYCQFITTFDIIISQNINKKFFENKFEFDIKKCSTMDLTEKWLKNIGIKDTNLILGPIRNIRNDKNKNAHKINTDKYHSKYMEIQMKILKECYNSLKLLIEILKEYYDLEYELENYLSNNQIITLELDSFKEFKWKKPEKHLKTKTLHFEI